MIKRFRFATALLLTVIFGALGISSAKAAIPFLIWERGKTQNIVLGGSTTSAVWNIYLVSSDNKSYEFSKSSPNPAKYIVYSIDLPANLPIGSYRVEAKDAAGDQSDVAGVSVIERTYYTITSIPNDLRLLFVLFAFFTGTFSVLRSRKYSMLSYQRTLRYKSESDEESLNVRPRVPGFLVPFYRFRQRREANLEISLLRFVVHRDGEVLHKFAPWAWAVLPFLTFIASILEAVHMQGHHALPEMTVGIYFAFTIIGSLDAVSGVSAALGLFISQLVFGDINSIRAFLLFSTFVAPWFVASLLGSLYYMTIRLDVWSLLKSANARLKTFLTLLLIAAMSGASVYATTIALQSMSIQLPVPKAFFLPLALTSGVMALLKNLLDYSLDAKIIKKNSEVTMKVESLYVARVLSPGSSIVILLGVVGIAFVWTQSMADSLVVAAVSALPFVALYLAFPYKFFARIPAVSRNVLVEALTLGGLTFLVFLALNRLPLSVIQKSKTFILLALVPLVLHAVYSLLLDSADRIKQSSRAEEKPETEIEKEGVTQ